MTIEDLLKKKEFQISEILRMNQVIKPGLEGIREGYEMYGDRFMLKVIDALKDENNFSNYNVDGEEIYFNTDGTIANGVTGLKEAPGTSGGWKFWETLLKTVGQTGQTIGALKNNVAGSVSNTPTTYVAGDTKANGLILYGALAAILVVVFILIFRKK
jgi:hypothetical protein